MGATGPWVDVWPEDEGGSFQVMSTTAISLVATSILPISRIGWRDPLFGIRLLCTGQFVWFCSAAFCFAYRAHPLKDFIVVILPLLEPPVKIRDASGKGKERPFVAPRCSQVYSHAQRHLGTHTRLIS